jgi:hypothetical protein
MDKLLESQIWLKLTHTFSRNRRANTKALCGVVSATECVFGIVGNHQR